MAKTLVNLAIVQRKRNEYSDAFTRLEEALGIFRRLAEENPEKHLSSLAKTLFNLANLQVDRKEYSDALAKYEEALGIYRTLAEERPEEHLSRLAKTLFNLANLQVDRKEYSDAFTKYGEALGVYRRLSEENPERFLPEVAKTLVTLGIFFFDYQPDKEKSIAYTMEALQLAKEYPSMAQQFTVYKDKALEILQANGIDVSSFKDD